MVLIGACRSFEVANENAPTTDQLEGNPTRAILARSATGIFTGVTGVIPGVGGNDVGGEIQQYGIYGRELYNLAGNDPRETGEELRGPQDPGGRGGAGWANMYAHIRSINLYLRGVTNSTELSEAEKRAALGFAKTIKAYHFHRLIVRTGPLGIPMDVDRAISDEPAPFVSQTDAYAAIVALLDEAKANVVVPDTIKAGLVFGGRRGHGVMSVKTPEGTWSNPVFVKLTGGSIGLQAGVQSSDVVLAFRSERGLESIVNGKFTLGADAGVAAGPMGRNAATATDGEFKAEIWSWSRARGLFAGVALDGAVLSIDDAANEAVASWSTP